MECVGKWSAAGSLAAESAGKFFLRRGFNPRHRRPVAPTRSAGILPAVSQCFQPASVSLSDGA